jgi:hypothetical protein
MNPMEGQAVVEEEAIMATLAQEAMEVNMAVVVEEAEDVRQLTLRVLVGMEQTGL